MLGTGWVIHGFPELATTCHLNVYNVLVKRKQCLESSPLAQLVYICCQAAFIQWHDQDSDLNIIFVF